MTQGLRQGCVRFTLPFNVFFAVILLATQDRFSENADIIADLAHLQEQPSKVHPETALECVRCAIWGMLYAEDACIVSRSPRGLERMMAIFVEVFGGAFGLIISESKTETMCMSISRAPATQIVFNAAGQLCRPITSFTYLGGAVTETPNLSDEIDRRIRAEWMSFRRYTRKLYGRPKASLLHLKARMVESEVVEALLYGCVTCILLGATTTSSVQHITECCFKSQEPDACRRTTASSPTKTPSSQPVVRVSKQTGARGGCFCRGR